MSFEKYIIDNEITSQNQTLLKLTSFSISHPFNGSSAQLSFFLEIEAHFRVLVKAKKRKSLASIRSAASFLSLIRWWCSWDVEDNNSIEQTILWRITARQKKLKRREIYCFSWIFHERKSFFVFFPVLRRIVFEIWWNHLRHKISAKQKSINRWHFISLLFYTSIISVTRYFFMIAHLSFFLRARQQKICNDTQNDVRTLSLQ